MAEITPEQFKIQHLRKRIAEITVSHEDALADKAMAIQMLMQERDDARRELQQAAQQILDLQEQLAELSPPVEQEETEAEISPEGNSEETPQDPEEGDTD